MEKEVYGILVKYLYGDNIGDIKRKVIKEIHFFIENNQPIEFVLPSFPGKSPNRNSSLNGKFGYEELYSINNIKKMLKEIKEIYSKGAKIYIVHDGHLFTDLNITRSDFELNKYIKEFRNSINNNIISISLKDLVGAKNYVEARTKFINQYVLPLDEKKLSGQSVKKETLFTKVEFEKRIKNHEDMSNNHLQMMAKKIAKASLLRKEGLSNCIKEKFPDAIRLSVHYQDKDSEKLGFKLIDNAINLGTPWFNIIYKCNNGDIILGKKNWFTKNRKLINSKDGCYYLIDDEIEENFKNNNVSKEIIRDMNIGR